MTDKVIFGLTNAIKAFADEAEEMTKEKDHSKERVTFFWSADERQKAKKLRKAAMSFLGECEEFWNRKLG